jgi:hypothetical protein
MTGNGSAAYRTASIRRLRASTPVSGSACPRSQFELRVWACRDALASAAEFGSRAADGIPATCRGAVRHRACHVATDGSRTDRPWRPHRRSGQRRRRGTAGRVAGDARRRRRPRGTSGESLAFLFAATGARRVRRPDHVVVAIGFTAAGGRLLLRRRCRRANRRVLRGGRLVVSLLVPWWARRADVKMVVGRPRRRRFLGS